MQNFVLILGKIYSSTIEISVKNFAQKLTKKSKFQANNPKFGENCSKMMIIFHSLLDDERYDSVLCDRITPVFPR